LPIFVGIFSKLIVLPVKDIYDIIDEFKKWPAKPLALATLIRAEGSSYRRPGARMLVCEDGTRVGSLSAGCLEDEVALRAGEVLQTSEPAIVSFDTRRRFGCAGRIDIFIERISEKFLRDLAQNLAVRHSCFVITAFGEKDAGSRIVRTETNRDYTQKHEQELIQKIHPPIRLLIVGDGPDNGPLRLFGNALGWVVIELADPNLLSIKADDWTATIVKSHNYGRDFIALEKLLPMDLRYVGLIGPRKRRDQLMNGLLDLGVTVNAGFFAPAGLDLGAETPEEIALSIVAEIQRVFAKGSCESLRERKISIHTALERVNTSALLKR
jgi:xanthine dehydrogenase accessory factor